MSRYKRCNMHCDGCDDPCDKGSIQYFLMLNVVSRLGIEAVRQKSQWWKEHGIAARDADARAESRSEDYLEYSGNGDDEDEDEDEDDDDDDMRVFNKIYDAGCSGSKPVESSLCGCAVLAALLIALIAFLCYVMFG